MVLDGMALGALVVLNYDSRVSAEIRCVSEPRIYSVIDVNNNVDIVSGNVCGHGDGEFRSPCPNRFGKGRRVNSVILSSHSFLTLVSDWLTSRGSDIP